MLKVYALQPSQPRKIPFTIVYMYRLSYDGRGDISSIARGTISYFVTSDRSERGTLILTLLQLDNLSIRRKKIKAQLMLKIGNAPSYLKSLFSVRTLECDVRNNRCKLNIPNPRTNYSATHDISFI